MDIDFSIEEVVKKRYSVRNYKDVKIESEKINEIKVFIDSLDNPFGKEVDFHLFHMEDSNEKKKLGTYGVIKGAKNYIGTTIKLEPMTLEALGYEFEAVVLYLAHLGLGTCWLGGTFDRKGFAHAMNIKEGELLPIISPYGYAAEKKHIKELAMRKMIKADYRKNWNELFFMKDFNTPLSIEDAGDFAFPLEMVRLAPSASNKQPWRVVVENNVLHFYEQKEPGYSDVFPYDIQRVDLGIAAAHFDFSVKQKGIKGQFKIESPSEITLPKNIEYAFSWIKD
ncbi:putative nitroreductase [Alkalibaculum bacchi]|uniref:Putative nitroreductase n=1 Tax=Alkalibaculum bacchi TaxID=645887 RepID=A0A366IAW9_9FIRM|nr:nitroreductase family protein [Alkalibaculum bacchi]RBP65323.1 putative nitroreductase [Alkalibaculum bacchi]